MKIYTRIERPSLQVIGWPYMTDSCAEEEPLRKKHATALSFLNHANRPHWFGFKFGKLCEPYSEKSHE